MINITTRPMHMATSRRRQPPRRRPCRAYVARGFAAWGRGLLRWAFGRSGNAVVHLLDDGGAGCAAVLRGVFDGAEIGHVATRVAAEVVRHVSIGGALFQQCVALRERQVAVVSGGEEEGDVAR